MSAIRFDWDPAKATLNLRKQGVSFGEARTVFEDEESLITPDPDHSVGEERIIIFGLSSALRVLVVIHCELQLGEVIRIIPARKADRQERAAYIARRTQ